ncbi:uncharacterized protein F5891DRAFT_1195816 [Suillus fuscotomentosus]|uniref:Uncharacterized protein n=1 Tax=Suillus fuscotomentosus TaxID=1912939 RepID=A0AAD4DU56_9AGAM|nr:uncharacterized protein F5891DRAFT_1195816 [Suillus fuscotomentosus]KAG1893897.1 hypothetical protein F5891DRAFT_1195816 [Suillus fuscotomentosus]
MAIGHSLLPLVFTATTKYLLDADLAHPAQRSLQAFFSETVSGNSSSPETALIGGFVGSYLRELDPQATEAAQVPLSEVLLEYPPDAGDNWGLSPPVPPLDIGHYVRFKWNSRIKAVAIILQFELSTAKA